MRTDHILNPIRFSLRQGNQNSLIYNIGVLGKKAMEKECPDLLRVEIHLEVAKAMRAIGRIAEAGDLCDRTMANMPAGSSDMLAALKRVRALAFLDAGDLVSAQSLIDETDGMELVLDKGQKHVDRRDSDVSLETWLVSIEVALARRDLRSAQTCFELAVNRLAIEEEPFRKKRVINPLERRKFEKYFGDLRQMLTFYGSVVHMVSGSEESRMTLVDLKENLLLENQVSISENQAPNIPFLSKVRCVLGEWVDRTQVPAGISSAEALRWADLSDIILQPGMEIAVLDGTVSASAMHSFPTSEHSSLPAVLGYSADPAVQTASSLARMAGIFSSLEYLFPAIMKYVEEGGVNKTFERGFKAHLFDVDLHGFLHNIKLLKLTGYVVFNWRPDLFHSAVLKGILPDAVMGGEAFLYAHEGIIVDATFKGDSTPSTADRAKNNFMYLTRMCLSLEVDDIAPDIVGEARWAAAVSDRERHLQITDNTLLFIASDIESQLAGLDVQGEAPTNLVPALSEEKTKDRLQEVAGLVEEELLEV